MMPFFFGRVDEGPGGTVVRGRFGVHPIPIIFLVCMLTFVAYMALFLARMAAAGHGTFSVRPALAILMPVAFGAIAVAVFWLGVALGKDQRQAILGFLESVLEASRE